MAAKKLTRSELSKPTFYDLTAEEAGLLSHLEEILLAQQAGEGDFTAQLEKEAELLISQLNTAHEARDAKLDRMCGARRRLLAQTVELTAEADRLLARAVRQQKAAEWIAAKIQFWMEHADPPLDVVETHSGANKISLGFAGKEPVEILNDSEEAIRKLPEDCWKEIPATVEARKEPIYKMLRASQPAEGDSEELAATKRDLAKAFDGIARLGERSKRLTFS